MKTNIWSQTIFGEADLRCRCCDNWVGNLNSLICIDMGTTEV